MCFWLCGVGSGFDVMFRHTFLCLDVLSGVSFSLRRVIWTRRVLSLAFFMSRRLSREGRRAMIPWDGWRGVTDLELGSEQLGSRL